MLSLPVHKLWGCASCYLHYVLIEILLNIFFFVLYRRFLFLYFMILLVPLIPRRCSQPLGFLLRFMLPSLLGA